MRTQKRQAVHFTPTDMANKAPGEFNMAAEIREILTGNPKLTAREAEELLRKKFPGQKINTPSLVNAFSMSRLKARLF